MIKFSQEKVLLLHKLMTEVCSMRGYYSGYAITKIFKGK